jgi:hypothetical protein
MSMRRLTTTMTLISVALLLSACTITIVPDPVVVSPRPDPVPSSVIERFESVLSSYQVGDRISFRIRTGRSGFVTLTAYDPDGSVYVIARNVPVAGNRIETIPAPFGRTSFVAAPPTGRHLVRAHFTPERTAEEVTFRGRVSLSVWLSSILVEIRGYGYGVDDIAETRFDIRR